MKSIRYEVVSVVKLRVWSQVEDRVKAIVADSAVIRSCVWGDGLEDIMYLILESI